MPAQRIETRFESRRVRSRTSGALSMSSTVRTVVAKMCDMPLKGMAKTIRDTQSVYTAYAKSRKAHVLTRACQKAKR